MATDLFNNPSNDYVNPGLSPCAGAGDDAYFEIGNGAAEITSGSDILAKLDLSDIKIGVSAYSIQNQILSEGEVAYIPGLTKGLQKRVLGFTIPDFYSHDEDLNKYFYEIDLSINYYKNFKYNSVDIEVSANYSQNINIEDALNIAFGNAGIGVTAKYDPSLLTFTGNIDGFNFDIPNIEITTIVSSDPSVFDSSITLQLESNPDVEVLYAKYPNGASQGIVMKGIYPSTTPQTPYDKWLYINHVTDFITIYDPVEVDNFIYNIQKEVVITFDPGVTFGPFISDVSMSIADVSCIDTGYTYDPSYGLPITYNALVDNSTLTYSLYGFSRITNSIIEYSGIFDFRVADPSSWYIADSSVYGSDLYDNNILSSDPESYAENCFISDSSITQVDVSGGFIQKSYVRLSVLENVDIACMELIEDSSVFLSNLYNFSTTGNDFYESGIDNMILTSSGIYDSSVLDSSIVSSKIQNTYLKDSDVSSGEVIGSVSQDTYYYMSTIEDSSIIGSAVDASSLISGSTLQGIYTNAYKLVTGDPSMPYIWVIDDPTLVIEDASMRVIVEDSIILDCSMNNTDINDSSIYTSYIQDASLTGCTLYNVTLDSSTTTLTNCRLITISEDNWNTEDCSISYDVDSSIFYNRAVKTIDVGMNGCSTANVMSAGDYLDWVNTNDYWYKFGDLYVWTTAPDGCSACHNLIDGFYVFNPHPFDIKIEYMLFI